MKKLFIRSILVYLLVFLSGCAGIGKFLSNRFWQPIDSVVKLKSVDIYGSKRQGTAVFIADDLLITAGHCVEDKDNITLVTADGKEIEAVSWYRADANQTDVGIIRVKTPKRERTLYFSAPILGEEVFVIGNPFGYFPVRTKGIVSSIGQAFRGGIFGKEKLFMVDAALNPGNSGCAIWNMSNRIVGIYVGGYHDMDEMDFCVPGPVIKSVVEEYLAAEKSKAAE